jgi:hypothetical protein
MKPESFHPSGMAVSIRNISPPTQAPGIQLADYGTGKRLRSEDVSMPAYRSSSRWKVYWKVFELLGMSSGDKRTHTTCYRTSLVVIDSLRTSLQLETAAATLTVTCIQLTTNRTVTSNRGQSCPLRLQQWVRFITTVNTCLKHETN